MSRWWWFRPIRALLIGVTSGLVATWAVSLLPERLQIWGILSLVAAVMIFVLGQHLSLRRDMKIWQQRMAELAELERELRDQ